ncbi:MAG: tetratricopeptide repeat protein [Limisphaerales bacterium]
MALMPNRSPAPLIYTPGEGWFYETPGAAMKWQRDRAKEQLDVAEQAFTNRDFTLALRAAHRVVNVWPLSDYAPRAEYLVGRCLEAKGKDEAAFNAYQEIIQKYPRSENYEEILWRQYDIAGRFLNGEWFRLWNLIPLYTSMDETAKLYEKIVANGPFSDVAPHAQLREGAAREKEKNYPDAAKAYAIAADRYHNQPAIAADAMYRQGVVYQKQSSTAEYDQGTAEQAIAAYTDFITLFPSDPRVAAAQKAIVALKAQQVRGNFEIAQFYEKSKVLSREQKRNGALVYYNEVLQLNPNSRYAAQARQRIEFLKSQTPPAG